MRRIGPRGRAASAILVALVAGCGEEQIAGGGGIETNNTVAARVLDASGVPVAGAEMVVRPSAWIPEQLGADSLAFRGLSDAAGRVEFSVPRGDWTIEVRSSGTGHLVSRRIESSGVVGDLVMRPMGRLRGVVRSAWPSGASLVGIRGTRHSTRPDSTGAYELDSLPPGELDLVVVAPGGNRHDRVDLAPASTVDLPYTGNPEIRALDSAGWIRLEDFRSASPTLASALPQAAWTLRDDRLLGGKSFFRRADSSSDSSWGRFLVPGVPTGKASFQTGARIDRENLVIGLGFLEARLELVDSTRCLDLSTLDYLRLGYTGTSSVIMEILTAVPDSQGKVVSNPSVGLQAWTDWKTLILDPAAFSGGSVMAAGASVSRVMDWSEASRCVQGVKFHFIRDADFGVFDLSIHGVTLERLVIPRDR